ncbi:hypothetical protein IGI04_006958 [Brassica rapa subsp. trilocularis]|uniref:Uncharacterized protein n=1 Tax=Brassica rapa subsp. trilocularis TaxID=1813537 RepID=A0ABQ7NLJ5_BRACM|nr:hypothetical protein IGI04_006958 [Brassica rapa subsp. trilocularis]
MKDHTQKSSNSVGTKIRTVDFRLNKQGKKTLNFLEVPDYLPEPTKKLILFRIRVRTLRSLQKMIKALAARSVNEFRMIDNPGRFKDDIGAVIWLFPGSELDMRGDRFSIFREFKSVCKIWLNSYGTIYRDRKNRLRLSSLDYPPRF